MPEDWKIFYSYEAEIKEGAVNFCADLFFDSSDFREPVIYSKKVAESKEGRVVIPVESGWYHFFHYPSRQYYEDGNSVYNVNYWVVWGITCEVKEDD